MVAAIQLFQSSDNIHNDSLFEKITADIQQHGLSINPMALPPSLSMSLHEHLHFMAAEQFEQAGVGRKQDYVQNGFVRTDQISWIMGTTEAGQQWLNWAGQLQQHLNRRLFLGLFSFESHFAHYRPGDFYKRHFDAFQGEANRILSVVVYLNPDWTHDQGGELVLYANNKDKVGTHVTPAMGTVVVFLSEEFPHEVLVAQRDRYSIAGWFRVNSSTSKKVDPPK